MQDSYDAGNRDRQASPRVSVVIATFNRARMVREAVEAAQAQTLPPFEIVVSDDASTDATWTVLEELAAQDPRVRVYRQQQNTGGAENWNHALRQASGDYIAWCSDDDRFLPDHLASAAAFLEANPGVGLTHASFVDAWETDSGTREPSPSRSLPGTKQEPRALRFGAVRITDRGDLLSYMTRYYDWPFHPSTIVVRREVLEQVGLFDPAFSLIDTDWFVRAMERYPVAMLPRHSVLNRRHPGNWSNRLGSARMQSEIFTIIEGAIERLHGGNLLARGLWRLLWRNNVRLRLLLTAWSRIQTGQGDAAVSCVGQMLAGTGHKAPTALTEVAQGLARRWASRRARAGARQSAEQTVSPL